jgi:hypothetical protein
MGQPLQAAPFIYSYSFASFLMAYNVTVDQVNYDALWCYLWASLVIDDSDAKLLASKLTSKGIDTWEKWVNRPCFDELVKL